MGDDTGGGGIGIKAKLSPAGAWAKPGNKLGLEYGVCPYNYIFTDIWQGQKGLSKKIGTILYQKWKAV